MLKYGEQALGLETGDPRDFKSWDDLWQAYKKQQLLFCKAAFTQQHIVCNLRAGHFAQPMGSALHDLCMKHALDLHTPQIPEGINLGYFECIGFGTVVDSLAAMKKLVFEEKKVSMAELIEALESDFKGKEPLRRLLKSAPCYGNNDPYTDEIAKEIDRVFLEYSAKYSKELGIHNDIRYVPFTSHVPFGRVVSATPNGRKAFTPLSDGSSASQGSDLNGPTAVMLSNYETKNYGFRERAARLLNIKFTPKCVEGDEGTRKLISFIRAFCDLKLWHVQFNVVNRQSLLAAQKDPEKYRSLIVRIAGYSAYFVDLSPDLQNDLIARTGHGSL
jgi:formate C-acetyltransferase